MNNIKVIAVSIVLSALPRLFAADITLTPRNLSDNAANYQIEFGTHNAGSSYGLSNQYVELNFIPYSDVPLWKIDIYTNNENSSLWQRGGLLNVSNPDYMLPVVWKAAVSTAASTSGDPDTVNSGWQWIKDKNDADIPATSDDESWQFAKKSGYTSVCSGNAEGIRLIDGTPCGTTAYVFLKANFNSAASGNYHGTIWFDMYPVIDAYPPVFIHEPLDLVIGYKNTIIIKGIIKDNENIQSVKIHYSTDRSTWQVESIELLGPPNTKLFSFKKKLSEFGRISQFRYALEASDGYNTAWYKTKDDPVVVNVKERIIFLDVLKGVFEAPDGTQDGTSTKIVIPDGALSEAIRLSILSTDEDSLPHRMLNGGKTKDKPIIAYDFGPEGTKFNRPITLTIHYFDTNDDGEVEYADGENTGLNEKDLKIYWWDGFEWRLVGGRLDSAMNTVTVETDHFSVYAIFAAPPMTADDYRPREKIITPATSGGDDVARFNGLNGTNFRIDLYDVTGKRFRTISSPDIPQWDGKDGAGNIVESGVYIYQFDAEVNGVRKLVSGTIIVAK